MENTEDSPTVTESQEKGGDSSIATNVDDEDYNKKMAIRFDRILEKLETLVNDKKVLNAIEKALVTNIKSDLSIVKELVAGFCTKKYIKEHVEGKVESIGKEVDVTIDYLKEKEEQNNKEAGKIEEKKMIKTSEWWSSIAKKTEKIKTLVSQFGTLEDNDDGSSASSSSSSKKPRQKTLSNTVECHNMCIEESLLISPIIMASLKKSYHHLPPELRLCLLSLSAFPESFIIKKRPLIYWWMAEGFVAAPSSSKSSAEEVGERHFTQLIQLGLIQPWYEAGNNNNKTQTQFPHVQGCRVHPWIRRMLVSIAMEAQLFEFFGINNKVQHRRSPRVCLYDDVEGSVEDIAIWKAKKLKYDKLRETLKWPKAKALNQKNHQKEPRHKEFSKTPKDLNEVSDRQDKLFRIFGDATQLNHLVADVSSRHERMKHYWSHNNNNNNHDALKQRLDNLKTTILHMKQKNGDDMPNDDIINKLHVEQMEQLNDVESFNEHVLVRANFVDRLLDHEVYKRPNICETLQNSEEFFRHNDLTNQFPFPNKKRTMTTTSHHGSDEKRASDDGGNDDHAEKLLAIINVTQSYLDMEHELFGKMKRLRTLHLGRWRDCLPVPHIELENTDTLFKALFRVAKHLKYLSLRGISRITELPKTISNCSNLQILDLKACYNLEKLPSQISSLSKLTHFDVSECYLLQDTPSLWTLVENLEFLQTLKGLKVDESSQYSLRDLVSSGSLRKMSIILTKTTLHINFSNRFANLRVLTITWRTENLLPEKTDGAPTNTENPPPQQQEKSDGGATTNENPPPQQQEKSEDSGVTHQDNGGPSTDENLQQSKQGKCDGGNPKQETSDEVEGIESLRQLKKLELRCYPYKAWPDWLKKHDSLETLYITGGNIEEFPMDDLVLPNLEVLRLKHLNHLKLGQDFNKSQLYTKFPSLKYDNIP